ncbi:MAG: hypothetical protein IPK82_23920 [Polyangiaceae bacterium]|nr:hypothetical protein [Polyangiaceae bacterium]
MIVGEAMEDLVREAILSDGRASFLNPTDNEEYLSDDIPGLPKGKWAFKILRMKRWVDRHETDRSTRVQFAVADIFSTHA